ncbi:hypothetical protein [Rheinheimera sp.]|uniref:hypothetical protein n=1 Tax=Rheinheimera sp. TaxID=1869214 RepID=UPI004047C599
MNTLTVLEILANADSIQSAVAQLTANGIRPTFKGSELSDGWYETDILNFWLYKGQIYVNTFDHPFSGLASAALSFYAQQQDSATQVPASASPVVEQPVIQQPSTETVDKSVYLVVGFDLSGNVTEELLYPEPPHVRNAIRKERLLRNSNAKGLSS